MTNLLLIFGLLALLQNASASDGAANGPGTKLVAPLILKVVSTEQGPREKDRFTHKIFLQSKPFESIDALKRHLLALPRGTRIEYDPSCFGIMTRPLAMSDDLEAFQTFCVRHDIQITYATHKGRIHYLPK